MSDQEQKPPKRIVFDFEGAEINIKHTNNLTNGDLVTALKGMTSWITQIMNQSSVVEIKNEK